MPKSLEQPMHASSLKECLEHLHARGLVRHTRSRMYRHILKDLPYIAHAQPAVGHDNTDELRGYGAC